MLEGGNASTVTWRTTDASSASGSGRGCCLRTVCVSAVEMTVAAFVTLTVQHVSMPVESSTSDGPGSFPGDRCPNGQQSCIGAAVEQQASADRPGNIRPTQITSRAVIRWSTIGQIKKQPTRVSITVELTTQRAPRTNRRVSAAGGDRDVLAGVSCRLAVSEARLALPNFYNITVRIAKVAARLAVVVPWRRDEFGASISP